MSMMTTIKISRELRDRISHDAAAAGTTAAGLISLLLDSYEREQRLAAVGRAYAQPDASYTEETAAWDLVDAEGWPERDGRTKQR